MARIRIIDDWLRSPVSGPIRHRAVMVVADSWAEQRVLMRAYAASPDQTRPTIRMHGAELAISPAGPDPHGSWGIHVEPPIDGRAQELRGQLELAARRLAGSKGNPPRLVDEPSRFDLRETSQWAPGAPADLPPGRTTVLGREVHEPSESVPRFDREPYDAPYQAQPQVWVSMAISPVTPLPHDGAEYLAEEPRSRALEVDSSTRISAAEVPRRRRESAFPAYGSKTQPGFALSPLAGVASELGYGPPPPVEAAPRPAADGDLARLVGRTMPLGFRIDQAERAVLNALGQRDLLSASEVAALVGTDDGLSWMEAFMLRLAEHGLDLIVPYDDEDGESTYALRR